jgi:hypothetical protein
MGTRGGAAYLDLDAILRAAARGKEPEKPTVSVVIFHLARFAVSKVPFLLGPAHRDRNSCAQFLCRLCGEALRQTTCGLACETVGGRNLAG